MPVYKAPVDEVTFLLRDVFHLDRYNNLPGFAEATPDVVEAVLGEAAKYSEAVLLPQRHRAWLRQSRADCCSGRDGRRRAIGTSLHRPELCRPASVPLTTWSLVWTFVGETFLGPLRGSPLEPAR